MKPCIIAANTVGKFFDVFDASARWKLTVGPWFIFKSPEKNNRRLMQMLWQKCDFLRFEALRQKFDSNFELIKAEFTQMPDD